MKTSERMSSKWKRLTRYVILAMTVASSFLAVIYFLFTPILVGFYHTDNGEVEYFLNRVGDPSFLVKTYVSGNQEPTIISVFVNLPNKVVQLETQRTDELSIPFSEVSPYITPWKGKDVNTSLLVIASYVKSGHVYYSAEEVEYNPQWVLRDYPMEVVSTINVIPREVNVNYAYLHSLEEELDEKVDATPHVYCPGCGGGSGKLDKYVINVTSFNGSAPCYSYGYAPIYEYKPEYKGIVIHNVEVPMDWLSLSNNVVNHDDYETIDLSSILQGDVEWEAVSNSSSYGGPNIGTSYSANVNWDGYITRYSSSLDKLFCPTMYSYYNATVAVVQYCIFTVSAPASRTHQAGFPIIEDEGNVTVTEVLYANPSQQDVGSAVEETTSYTCVEYHAPNGTETSLISGNGTPTMLYQIEGIYRVPIPGIRNGPAFSPYAEVKWSDSNINYYSCYNGNDIAVSGNSWEAHLTDVYVHVSNPDEVPTDILGIAVSVALSLSTEGLGGLAVNLIATAVLDYLSIHLPASVQTYSETDVMTMRVNGSGTVYLSYENYSAYLPEPNFGFLMNYTNFYGE
ncbi:hypothetical protein IC006_0528 [Sulfuracidifex tepidarius]|uniref:Uncharacterized protein n=1 Tax=Sulfuracidifex tepidarius TaxID=1294262 RepID=A0A510DSV0_9CREN|nr:hypothetical protein [Sulfuracidifex tepidarius]BBG23244.1 hypothetical protein IC006_0528 [Sulfuracidifex tepidarius]